MQLGGHTSVVWHSQGYLENVKVVEADSIFICNEHVFSHSVFYFVVTNQLST